MLRYTFLDAYVQMSDPSLPYSQCRGLVISKQGKNNCLETYLFFSVVYVGTKDVWLRYR